MARSEVERAHFGMWGGSFKEPSRYRACRVVSERIPDAWGVIDAAAKQAPAKVRVEGPKWILDGTPIEQNSLQRKAYGNQPGWRGRSNFTDAQLREILKLALERPTQLALHVVGDAETDRLLKMMEQLASASASRDAGHPAHVRAHRGSVTRGRADGLPRWRRLRRRARSAQRTDRARFCC